MLPWSWFELARLEKAKVRSLSDCSAAENRSFFTENDQSPREGAVRPED